MSEEIKNEAFGSIYSSSYDSIYREKNYEEECDFLEKLFKANGKEVKTILDLGCGTGGSCAGFGKKRIQGYGR